MVVGTSEDTGLARERQCSRRLAFPAEEIADQRNEIVIKNLEAFFGSETGVHRPHQSQQPRRVFVARTVHM
jgi:hypothetical protein